MYKYELPETFISYYSKNAHGYYEFRCSLPVSPNISKFSKEISELSPTFVEIYTQSMLAQGYNLDQLVGIGLRKAIEYLVKDYAIFIIQMKKKKY